MKNPNSDIFSMYVSTITIALFSVILNVLVSPGWVSAQDHAARFDADRFVNAYENALTNNEFVMPYEPYISIEERIAGLSLLWSEAKFNFANFDLVDLNIDSLYLAYIPKVMADQNTLEYTQLLQSFYAQFKDGHTGVAFPEELMNQVYAMPGVLVEKVEGKPVITNTVPGYTLPDGVSVGDEIIKVDGFPVNEFITTQIAPYVSASTPQDSVAKILKFDLLSGDANQKISLSLKNKHGKIFSADFSRMEHHGMFQIGLPVAEYKLLENNIGYLALNTFNDEAVVPFFESRFDKISNTDALIIDVRQNSGGNTQTGMDILSQLTDERFMKSTTVIRKYDPAARPWGNPLKIETHTSEVPTHEDRHYGKPVVLLIGPSTYSAAEDFVVAFRQANRGVIMGEPTAGSTGQPYFFRIPGGGLAYVCTLREYFYDETEFIGTGILPDILINRSLNDLHNTIDTVLEAAIREVSEKMQ